MKEEIRKFLKQKYPEIDFDVSYPPDGFGDYSTNLAFSLAREGGESLQKVTLSVVEGLKKEFSREFEKIETAKNGFVNFYLSKEYLLGQLGLIINNQLPVTNNQSFKINLEFVSANPTGPLTLGNARSAAYGGALANILEKAGYRVTREYYINDVGNQVELLAESVKRRFKQLEDENIDFPEEFYQGDYIVDLAKEAKKTKIPPERLKEFTVEKNLNGIKKSLADFGIKFDVWFRESALNESDEIKAVLTHLEHSGLTYKKDGAVWFKGMEFGLDKDVVLVKSNGQGTYLLSDFAYAENKLSRDFDVSIYLLGADHHDNVKRLKAGIKALGLAEAPTPEGRGSDRSVGEKFVFLLHQLVALKKGGEVLRMAKRKGVYVTLDDLLEQIPKDVAKYFFLEKSLDTHLEFDLELAKEQSSKNPVYYIQYAFARINSVFEKSRNFDMPEYNFEFLKEKEELDLVRYLIRFPEAVFDISRNYQVHHLTQYAFELANKFHKFYEVHQILDISTSRNIEISAARLALAKAVQKVLGESLSLMGLSAPEKM